MATLTGPAVLNTNDIDLYQTTTQLPSGYSLGQTAYGNNGNMYRLALVGGSPTALVMGNMLQSSVVDTQFTNMAVPTAVTAAQVTAGTYQIDITNGTTTVSANQFDGGTLTVYTAGTVAIGDTYYIVGHSTGTSGQTLTIYLDKPLRAAFTTSAKVNMRRSPWSGVIQSPASTLTGSPAGAAMFATPASTAVYCFVQTHGVVGVLSDGSSILVGSEVALPSGTAGAVILSAAGFANVGYAMQAAAASHAIAVDLRVD